MGSEEGAELLQRLPVQQGDVVFVPAGTVHALGPGIIVAEIQQNSDTTYRIYDWGRPRPLHLEQALDVLNFEQSAPGALVPYVLEENGVGREEIGNCHYFRTERLQMARGSEFRGTCDGTTFEIWGVMEGTATIRLARWVCGSGCSRMGAAAGGIGRIHDRRGWRGRGAACLYAR